MTRSDVVSEKRWAATITWFLWDGSHLLAEYEAAGARIKRYAYLSGKRATRQLRSRTRMVCTTCTPITLIRRACLPTPARRSCGSRGYEAFGKAVVQRRPDGNGVRCRSICVSPDNTSTRETGLHYNFMRDYDPDRGRYIQADPFGQDADPNLFGYALNNPLNEIDPTGEIVPALLGYARCVAQCMALDALLGGLECFDAGESAKDCALSCLNPLKWLGGGAGKAPGFAKGAKGKRDNQRKLDEMKKRQKEAEHKQGKSKSKKDKHTKPRPGRAGDKKRRHPGWRQK